VNASAENYPEPVDKDVTCQLALFRSAGCRKKSRHFQQFVRKKETHTWVTIEEMEREWREEDECYVINSNMKIHEVNHFSEKSANKC
jgi:hypothetical protein